MGDENKALMAQVTLPEAIEKVLISGDLKELLPEQRVQYYNSVCKSLGLNPLTRPFDYIILNGKLTLYARKDATEQLRQIHGVSITKLEKDFNDMGLYIVTAYAQDKLGRTDVSTGAVGIKNMMGDALANAIMKAETKAKRRVTLSICGLGWMDESEIDTVRNAKPVVVDEAGDIIEAEAEASPNGSQPPEPVPVPPPAPEPQPVGEPTPTPNKVKIWTGKRFAELDIKGHITPDQVTWFMRTFVGVAEGGKQKAFKDTFALFGNPTVKEVEKRGHLGKWYHRLNFVDRTSAMSNSEFAELVRYAWYMQGERDESKAGLALPRYHEKFVELLGEEPPVPYDEHIPASVSVEELTTRGGALQVDLTTLAQAAFGAETIKTLADTNDRQRLLLSKVLDGVVNHLFTADEFDKQIEWLMMDNQ